MTCLQLREVAAEAEMEPEDPSQRSSSRSRSASSYSALRGAPVISAASFTAPLTGRSAAATAAPAGPAGSSPGGAVLQHQRKFAPGPLLFVGQPTRQRREASVATSSNCS